MILQKKLLLTLIFLLSFSLQALEKPTTSSSVEYLFSITDNNGIKQKVRLEYIEYSPAFQLREDIFKVKWGDLDGKEIENTLIRNNVAKTKEQYLDCYDPDSELYKSAASRITDEKATKFYSYRLENIKVVPFTCYYKMYITIEDSKYCIVCCSSQLAGRLLVDSQIYALVNGKWKKTDTIMFKYKEIAKIYSQSTFKPDEKEAKARFLKTIQEFSESSKK